MPGAPGLKAVAHGSKWYHPRLPRPARGSNRVPHVPHTTRHRVMTCAGGDMIDRIEDGSKADLSVQRALAIVLRREVLPLLDTLGENVAAGRSEGRSVGKVCVSTVRSRWSPYP